MWVPIHAHCWPLLRSFWSFSSVILVRNAILNICNTYYEKRSLRRLNREFHEGPKSVIKGPESIFSFFQLGLDFSSEGDAFVSLTTKQITSLVWIDLAALKSSKSPMPWSGAREADSCGTLPIYALFSLCGHIISITKGKAAESLIMKRKWHLRVFLSP